MQFELVLFCALVLAAAIPLFCRAGWRRFGVVAGAILIGTAGFGAKVWSGRIAQRHRSAVEESKHAPRQDRSDGYVSSRTCEACHPDQYQSWHRSFHRTMTQVPSRASIVGSFD